jgi:DNA repair ATPase RecN
MISKVRVQNFQSWPDTEIHLHPGLNVFLGSGDSGKTSIASRAFRWVQENRIRHDNKPMGDNYVSRWAKKTSAKGTVTLTDDCSVTITRPDGSYCRRFRESAKDKSGKEVNGYELNGERFEAIGVGVPDAVSKWFNWSDVNVQKQHDQAFLISKGSGEVASFLNRTVKLDDIDAHITAAASLLRAEKAALERLKEDQEADSKALEALAWVEGAQGRLLALESLEAQRLALETKSKRLQELVAQMQEARAKIQTVSKVLELEPQVKALRREWDWCRGLQEQGHRIRETAARWSLELGTMAKSRKLADLWPRVQSLKDIYHQWRAEDVAQGYIHTMVGNWQKASKSLQEAGKLVSLAPRVQAIRDQWEQVQEAQRRLQGIRSLVSGWPVVRVVDWEGLESRVRRTKAMIKGIEGRRELVAGLQNYRLTFAGLQATILETGKLVSELEAQRPETCPVCGGAMHKDQNHG